MQATVTVLLRSWMCDLANQAEARDCQQTVAVRLHLTSRTAATGPK